VPTLVSGLSGIVAIDAGVQHTCAIGTSRSVSCWGANAFGELGDGTTTVSDVPVAALFPSATHVAAGFGHTCAVHTDGMAWCWGMRVNGRLGDGTASGFSTAPVPVAF
jgi:alpha-tubulin suppressor-like RCC1 family protein